MLGRGNLRGSCSSRLSCPHLCGGPSARGLRPKLHRHQESLLLRACRSATCLSVPEGISTARAGRASLEARRTRADLDSLEHSACSDVRRRGFSSRHLDYSQQLILTSAAFGANGALQLADLAASYTTAARIVVAFGTCSRRSGQAHVFNPSLRTHSAADARSLDEPRCSDFPGNF
jgi:hypothetical protein